jgi:hypothetical protein
VLTATFAPLAAGALARAPHPAAGRLADVVSRLAALDARGGDVRRADGPLVAVDSRERVLVDINVNGDAAAAARRLQAAGLDVTAATNRAPVPVVEGWLPLDRADAVSALGVVQTVDAVGRPERDVVSQGDAAHHGPQARAITPGVSGAGVSVGVVSDSINQVGGGVAASQASGDLPPDVVVVADGAPTDADEGRAMAEIIYDEARGIPRIEFATGNGGAVSKAARISLLASHGVSIIADDVPYLSEPFFQDGVVSQAVDAVRSQGVVYLASAGNRARQSWEGTFTPSGVYNDFDPGAGVDTEQTIVSLAPNARITINLQWAEPWGAAVTDLNAVLMDETTGPSGIQAVAGPADHTADTFDNIGHNPSLLLTWKNTTAAPVPVGLRIWRAGGSGTPFIKWMARRDPSNGFVVSEHPTNSPTINPDAAAATGALAVGAIRYSDAGLDTPEAFSSYGPLVRRFAPNGAALGVPESRAKPELAAADGVATSLPGFAPFFGTSASVASAAGVAALVKSARPWLTADALAGILTNPANTHPCSVVLACGNGFVFADRAVQGLDSTPPAVTGALAPPAPDGTRGWYRTTPVATWSAVDPESVATGCPPSTITVEGSFSAACTGSSVGGSAAASLQGKRDDQPPQTPTVKGLSKTYYLPRLPKSEVITCRAIDLVSGFASCRVMGVSTKLGTHTATARAADNAGNVVTRTVRYVIARRPDTKIRKAAGLKRALRVSFTGSGGAGRRTFECRVDRRPFARCASPKTFSRLRAGVHAVAVRARDASGTADPSPARASVVVR